MQQRVYLVFEVFGRLSPVWTTEKDLNFNQLIIYKPSNKGLGMSLGTQGADHCR